MKARATFHLLLAAVVFLAAGSAGAQSSGPLSLQADWTVESDFPAVTLAVTVRDANGVPLPDLTAADFEVLEKAIDQPRPVTAVETVSNPEAQLSVILVLDISGSMVGQPLADAQEAAIHFLAGLNDQDQVALLAFADAVDFDALDPGREHDFTSDKGPLFALIDGLAAEGGTPLYDALFKAITLADRADLGHRAILLLTDGVDEGPGSQVASDDTPVTEAQRANLPIFSIGLGTRTDPGYLERLARATGGVYQHAPDSAALDALFQNVADRLKQQYLVSYQSGYDCDGQEHRVEISVELGGRSASDSILIGPLPDNPGCNPAAVATPTAEPSVTPPPSATPYPPTATPEPSATPIPSATATTAAAAAAAPTLPPPPAASEAEGKLSPFLVGVGVVLLLALLSVVIWLVLRGRRPPARRCMQCGYRLREVDTACPQCGSRKISPGVRK